MATIVNTPGGTSDSSSSAGIIIAVVVLVIVVLLLFTFGLPFAQRGGDGGGSSEGGAPQVNVPDQVDVNVRSAPPQY